LPRNTKAHLFANDILYWGPFYWTLKCWRKHLPRSHLSQVVNGHSLEHREYFDKHFTNMLQKHVCENKDCFYETDQGTNGRLKAKMTK
jgi:hypothetical protein